MKNKLSKQGLARLSLIASMTVFGTIGIFRRYLPLSSGVIALARGLIGTLSLLLILLITRQHMDRAAIRKNLLLLCISGAAIGFNWILLFEAYRYTTVATATLCYYMAPIFVILASPFVLRERMSLRRGLCVGVALAGMVLVSGILRGGLSKDFRGILFGLGAAALYASVILMNKRLVGLNAYDKTILQLGVATVVLIPYTLLAETVSFAAFTPTVILVLLVVGVVHTGLSYAMYFGSISSLSAQSVAIFSYIDPVVAILLSALLLHEPMGILEIVGAVLILGSAVVSELE